MSMPESPPTSGRQITVSYPSAQAIESYGPGFFRIGTHVLQGATLVTPWDAGAWAGAGDLAPVLTLAGWIDVLLLGQGAEIAPVPRAFRTALEAVGIGVEMMNTPAACRSYNLLVGEGRRVAAALLPMPTP